MEIRFLSMMLSRILFSPNSNNLQMELLELYFLPTEREPTRALRHH
jgi:hypothetical protein